MPTRRPVASAEPQECELLFVRMFVTCPVHGREIAERLQADQEGSDPYPTLTPDEEAELDAQIARGLPPELHAWSDVMAAGRARQRLYPPCPVCMSKGNGCGVDGCNMVRPGGLRFGSHMEMRIEFKRVIQEAAAGPRACFLAGHDPLACDRSCGQHGQ